LNISAVPPHWEHFEHDADIGIRGIAPTIAQAFEQAAIAMTAVITDPDQVLAQKSVSIQCSAPDFELLLVDWINELIYTMAVHNLLFSRYQVTINQGVLSATALGEPLNREKHQPAVEIKGATFTELQVYQQDNGTWLAQCIVDV
jgi:SHS2 domain-containing protein